MANPQTYGNLSLYVRGFPKTAKPVICIIVHRMLLVCHFKHLKFEIVCVDPNDKAKVLDGTMTSCELPFFSDGDFYSDDLIDMFNYLGKTYPAVKIERPLKIENEAKGLYPAFRLYIKNAGTNRADGFLARLIKELTIVDNQLALSKGPYIDGAEPSSLDTIIFPKLYQIHEFFSRKNLPDPMDSFPSLKQYFAFFNAIPEFQQYKPCERSLEVAFARQ